MYTVHDGEKDAIKEWASNNNYDITYNDVILNKDTVILAQGYDGICIQQTQLIDDEFVYQKLHEYGFKHLSLRIAGYDIINMEYAKKYQLLISIVPAYSPNAVAEMALSHTMYLTRKMYHNIAKVNHHNFTWDGSLANEIRSMTIGVIGFGRIGRIYAQIMKAIGARVIVYDVIKPNDLEGCLFINNLDDLLKKADVISIHIPLTKDTKYLICEDTLKLMKPTAYLINTSRGAIVNTNDLVFALEHQLIAGAGLDTLECESDYFEKDFGNDTISDSNFNKLLAMNNVLITPHISFYTTTALKNMVDIGLDNIKTLLEDGECLNIVT
jgi:D-lactate dehydrogenase